MNVVCARGSQVERLAIDSEYEGKKIGEAYASSGDALLGGSTPRLGRCEEGDTEGWKDARVSGRGGESPCETRGGRRGAATEAPAAKYARMERTG